MAFANLKETTFTPAPAGSHAARAIKFVDLGTQETVFGRKRQLLVTWELTNTSMDDGRPFTISNWYTASLSRKSNFRRDIEGWLGRGLSSEEIEQFSPSLVAETPCLLSIVHEHSKDGLLRAHVKGVAQLPEGMAVAARISELLIFDLNKPDQAVLEQLPEKIQERIKTSPEWHHTSSTVPDQNAPDLNQDAPLNDALEDIA